LALLDVAVLVQLRARRFQPAILWTAIALTSTAGTAFSHLMNRTGGIGYTGGAIVLSTGTHHRIRRLVAMLYWIAILMSTSLGSSSGDFLADSSGLGFSPSASLLSIALLTLLALHCVAAWPGVPP
jgi:uncharacterized membrane-anchored protein